MPRGLTMTPVPETMRFPVLSRTVHNMLTSDALNELATVERSASEIVLEASISLTAAFLVVDVILVLLATRAGTSAAVFSFTGMVVIVISAGCEKI